MRLTRLRPRAHIRTSVQVAPRHRLHTGCSQAWRGRTLAPAMRLSALLSASEGEGVGVYRTWQRHQSAARSLKVNQRACEPTVTDALLSNGTSH